MARLSGRARSAEFSSLWSSRNLGAFFGALLATRGAPRQKRPRGGAAPAHQSRDTLRQRRRKPHILHEAPCTRAGHPPSGWLSAKLRGDTQLPNRHCASCEWAPLQILPWPERDAFRGSGKKGVIPSALLVPCVCTKVACAQHAGRSSSDSKAHRGGLRCGPQCRCPEQTGGVGHATLPCVLTFRSLAVTGHGDPIWRRQSADRVRVRGSSTPSAERCDEGERSRVAAGASTPMSFLSDVPRGALVGHASPSAHYVVCRRPTTCRLCPLLPMYHH